MTLIFQYGSNTSSRRLNSNDRLCGDARQIGIAYTEDDFELDFTVWSERNQCAAADIVLHSGRKIWGVLYEIPDFLIRRDTSGDRKSLDAIEGEGVNYRRTPIRLRRPDGSPIIEEVITYIVIDEKRRKGVRISLEYGTHIIAGLREHGVPDEYIDYVKLQIARNNPLLREDIEIL